jgi:hypothetical protein
MMKARTLRELKSLYVVVQYCRYSKEMPELNEWSISIFDIPCPSGQAGLFGVRYSKGISNRRKMSPLFLICYFNIVFSPECLDSITGIAGHNYDAVIFLDSLKQVGYFLVGIAVMRIFYIGTFAKQ